MGSVTRKKSSPFILANFLSSQNAFGFSLGIVELGFMRFVFTRDGERRIGVGDEASGSTLGR